MIDTINAVIADNQAIVGLVILAGMFVAFVLKRYMLAILY